ncbi:T9SS type A sorting domain-containing protein, partial [Bacteroidota bacterium]
FTYDIGISSISSPETKCELGSAETVDVSVINNSQDTLLTGGSINLSYSLNGGASVDEILVLSRDLKPDSIVDYTFTATCDLTSQLSHNLKITCSRIIDVNDINDTLSVNIAEAGYPDFSLGDDILTTNPVGTVINGPVSYASYEWQDGSTSSNFTITHPASAQYSLIVTDAYGCEGFDTLEVYTYDVAASSLLTPISQCELTATETVSMSIINNSLDTLLSGETINVSYILNSGTPVNESFNLSADSLKPTETVNYTFTQTADLSNNQVHEFELYAELASADVVANDTLSVEVDYQKPEFDLGPDVNTGEAEYIIDAGSGYDSYDWFDGETTTQTYTVDINNQSPTHLYWVTVTNSDGCSDADTIEVSFTTVPDLSVTSMISPESVCWQVSETYPVHIVITNVGVVNLTSGTPITIGYTIDDGTAVTETFNLPEALYAGATREDTIGDEISFASAKVYEFKPFVKLADDENANNDTLSPPANIDISAPEVDFVGQSDSIYINEGSSYTIQINGTYFAYSWDYNNATTSSITVSDPGSYTVTVTDENYCTAEGTFYVLLNTGIDNLIKGDGYQITYYPNPVSEQLMIQFDNRKSTDVFIEIVSSNGQLIYNQKLSNIKNTLERIDLNNYANGIYYLRLRIDQDLYTRKIIIQ